MVICSSSAKTWFSYSEFDTPLTVMLIEWFALVVSEKIWFLLKGSFHTAKKSRSANGYEMGDSMYIVPEVSSV